VVLLLPLPLLPPLAPAAALAASAAVFRAVVVVSRSAAVGERASLHGHVVSTQFQILSCLPKRQCRWLSASAYTRWFLCAIRFCNLLRCSLDVAFSNTC
jgi:hypothetical protein